MKSKSIYFFVLGFIYMLDFSAIAQGITCTIKGTIIDRDSKNIFLNKGTDDVRSKHPVIPIINNSFEYTFTVPAPEVYHLVFEDEFQEGMGRRIEFFPENGEVLFTLYPIREGNKNKIEGGKLNKQLQGYWFARNTYYETEVAPKIEPFSVIGIV